MDTRQFVPAEVAAGFPSPGQEWKEHVLDLRQLLGLAAEGSTVQRIAGNALLGIGVQDGDLLLHSSLVGPATNDVIIAQVNGVMYIRRYATTMRHIFLLPTDLHHHTIRVEAHDQFRVVGVVLCSIHPIERTSQKQLRACPLQLLAVNAALGLDEPSVYCSQVRGHSMHNAGIFEGDVLVIDRGRAACEHDIIVASWRGGYVVKRLIQESEIAFLLSDNPLNSPLIVTPASGFQFWGVVLFSLHPLHDIVKQRLSVRRHKRAR